MWQPGPAPEVREGDVHVWRVPLDIPEASVQQLGTLLAHDELARAGRFRFERDRRRFIVARGSLRTILGEYLEHPPSHIQFGYEDHGKPYLAGWGALHFNVSHSNELALMALCLNHRVGIDIEFKNRDRATMDVAKHFFASEEVAVLSGLETGARSDAFFAIWSMKEAYIKGRGEGVSLGLDTFAVGIGAGLLRSAHDDTGSWRFWNIAAASDYAAALTVEGSGDRRVSYWATAGAKACD